MTWSLVAVGGVSLVLVAGLYFAWQNAVGALTKEKAGREADKKAREDADRAAALNAAAYADRSTRLEAVINGLKKEISSLESDLATCRSPDAIRARLRSLLASGGALGDFNPDSTTLLPPQPSTKTGPSGTGGR